MLLYYTARHKVDDNSNVRQNMRAIEDCWQTKEWSHRAFVMVFGISEANAFLIFKQFVDTDQNHFSFRKQLCTDLFKQYGVTSSANQRVHRLKSYKQSDPAFGASKKQN
jgi:hypothetical protein